MSRIALRLGRNAGSDWSSRDDDDTYTYCDEESTMYTLDSATTGTYDETLADEGSRYTVDTCESECSYGTRETDDRRRFALRTVEEEDDDIESVGLLSTFFSSKNDDRSEFESVDSDPVDSATIGTYDETLADEGSRYTVDTYESKCSYGTRETDVHLRYARRLLSNRAPSVAKDMLANSRNVGSINRRRIVSSAPVKATSPKAGESNEPAPIAQVKPTSPNAKKASALPKTAPSAPIKPLVPQSTPVKRITSKKFNESNVSVQSSSSSSSQGAYTSKPKSATRKWGSIRGKNIPSDDDDSVQTERAVVSNKLPSPRSPRKNGRSGGSGGFSLTLTSGSDRVLARKERGLIKSKPEQPTREIYDEGVSGDAREDTLVERPETWEPFNFLPGCGVLETGSLGDSNAEELIPWHANRKNCLPEATWALPGETVVESRDEGSPGNPTGLGEGRREGAATETFDGERRQGSPMKGQGGTSKTSFFGGRRFSPRIGWKSKKNWHRRVMEMPRLALRHPQRLDR